MWYYPKMPYCRMGLLLLFMLERKGLDAQYLGHALPTVHFKSTFLKSGHMQNWRRPKSEAFSSQEDFEYSALLHGIFLSVGVSRLCSLGCCHSIHHPAPPLFLQSALLSGQREATLNSTPLPSDTPDLLWCRRWHAAFLWGTLLGFWGGRGQGVIHAM